MNYSIVLIRSINKIASSGHLKFQVKILSPFRRHDEKNEMHFLFTDDLINLLKNISVL